MFKSLENRSLPWFTLGLIGIFLFSLSLRFWGLGRFNTLVFDEIYYAKFANNYLTGTQFFNAHPPLSQYIIAIGIWIGDRLPIGRDTLNFLTGSLRSTFSYRWLNALTGSFIPLVIAGIAYQLSHRRSYALIAALFAAVDGFFLVESRYALNNIYLVILGLLGQWCFLLALSNQGIKRWSWLAVAGVFFGASASIKWNGLWFLLGIYWIWIAAWIFRWILSRNRPSNSPQESATTSRYQRLKAAYMPLQNLTQLKILPVILGLGIVPVLVYSLLWIPHLQMNPKPGFWEMQTQILSYHERIGDGPDVHPYCSRWYTWILMIRPIAYYYESAIVAGQNQKVIYDVHAIGNPLLWWFSTAAIVLLLVQQSIKFSEGAGWKFPLTSSTWMGLYLLLNYAANLLPWAGVTRCVFLYHYMGSSVFASLALAKFVDLWLHSPKQELKATGITAIALILMAFIFWMPIYLGLPLSPQAHQLRFWFPSWI